MARGRKRYTREFQLNAARMVVEQGFTRAEVGEKLGVSAWSIGRWIARFQESGELGSEPEESSSESETADPAEELRQLRKEVGQLRLENEIPKKATAYFAKELL